MEGPFPKVALAVADCFDKIRVNPGNFADGRKKFETILYETDEEYNAEVREVRLVKPHGCCMSIHPDRFRQAGSPVTLQLAHAP
jgi:4-hydroxy-3-methylbut-2-en-1-yl diphosphate synthase IspG/GcpE